MSRLGMAGALVAMAALTTTAARAEPRSVSIGWLMVMDWDSDYPEAADCLVNHPDKPAGWSITHKNVWLSDVVSGQDKLSAFQLVVTTGHGNLTFTAEERAVLEHFLDGGGVLWIDDCGSVQIDNFPFGLEIDFGAEAVPTPYPAWGTCFGDHFNIPDPNHPLVQSVFQIVASGIRTDPGLKEATWFTPMFQVDPTYKTVVEGTDTVYNMSGPAVVALRRGKGKIVATAMDITCALQCQSYANGSLPLFDYRLVFNMLAWVDTDGDNIYDRDEGAFTSTDTNLNSVPDYLDADTDGDGITDYDEAGDFDPDTPPVDTDSDGTPDFRDTDSDQDGIDDRTEHLVDSNLDGLPDPDVDKDGKPNQLDDDTDGDGKADAVEGTGDLDGDGIPNFADANDQDGPLGDLDGDGKKNKDDNCPGVANPGQQDTDHDGVGDGCETDSGLTDAGGGGSGGSASAPHDGGAGSKHDGGPAIDSGPTDSAPPADAPSFGLSTYDPSSGSEGGCGCRMARPATAPLRLLALGFALALLVASRFRANARRRNSRRFTDL
jgi:hypothetical protein